MERWQEVVADCGGDGFTVQGGLRIVAVAKNVLADDLANFEIDEVVGDLAQLVSAGYQHRTQESWSKLIGELLDLLAEVLPKYQNHMDDYLMDVVKLCMHGGYGVLVKKKAMQCLVALSRCSNAGSCMESVLPTSLTLLRRNDESLSVRVPLALLIGSICENYSELIIEPIAVWRSYCAILEASKTTVSLASAVITGITGLFNKFGQDIPVVDLNSFANNILTNYIGQPQCEEAVLQLVKWHAILFRELLASDSKYRLAVWRGCGNTRKAHDKADATVASIAAKATVAMYGAVAMVQPLNQDIIWTEILEQSKLYPHAPNLFLRCAWAVVDERRSAIDPTILERLKRHTAKVVSAIEFELECKVDSLADERSDKWEYDDEAIKLMEKALWWVSRGEPGSEVALRYLVRLQHKCPSTRRKKLVAHPILTSRDNCGIVGFLINESCQNIDHEPNIQRYLPLWRDLFNTQGGSDQVVMDNARPLCELFVDCLLSVVGVCLEKREFNEEIKDKMSTLFLLASSVLSLEHVEAFLQDSAESLLVVTLDCGDSLGLSEGVVSMVTTLVHVVDRLCLFGDGILSAEVVERVERFYKALDPVRCGEERVLVRVCRALVAAPTRLKKLSSGTYVALQIILSRRDVAPALVSKALRCLEEMMTSQAIDHKAFSEIKTRIEKMGKSKMWAGKDARVLRRNIYMFLGKFGSTNNSYTENEVFKPDVLSLNLPDPVATFYKLELAQMYEASVRSEDSEALWACLLMLCSAVASDMTTTLEPQLARTVYALARCYSRGELDASRAPLIEQAALWCAKSSVVERFVQYISEEKSPGVRKVLSNILEQILLQNPHSERSQELLMMITEKAESMLASPHSTTQKAGLDITECIIPALKENNELSKSHVTELLTLILKTKDGDFQASYKALAIYLEENIVIFEKYKLDALARDVIDNLFENVTDFTVFRNVAKRSLELVKIVNGYLKEADDMWKATEFTSFDKKLSLPLFILAEAKLTFEWDAETCRELVSYKDFSFVNAVLKCCDPITAYENDEDTEFLMEAILRFLEEYAPYLMEFQYEKTSKILAHILTRQPAKMLKKLHHQLSDCIQKYQNIWYKTVPLVIQNGYKNWFDNLPLKDISDKLKFQYANQTHRDVISALKITLSVLNSKDLVESLQRNVDLVKEWPKVILGLFESTIVNMDRTKIEYLTDVLAVSLHFTTKADAVASMCVNLKYYQKFVKAFGGYLLREPEALSDVRLKPILKDVVKDLIKYAVMQKLDEKKQMEVIELVDRLWPKLIHEPVRSLHCIMSELSLLQPSPLALDSSAGRWLLQELARPAVTLEDRAMLVEMLPCVMKGGVSESEPLLRAIKCYEEMMPHLLSELSERCSPRCFKAALSALAATKSTHLMKLVLNVAIGDKKSGWWDRAIEKCMEALADSNDVVEMLLEHALKPQYLPHSRILLMERLLVPLLQWSSPGFCERLFSSHLCRLLSMLTSVPSDLSSASAVHLDKYLLDYIIAFNLARVLFEKVSHAALESCDSPLYATVRAQTGARSWWLVPHVCSLCVSLRMKLADAPKSEYIRQFHCANYNCLAAAITKRGVLKVYKQLFNPQVWPLVIDCDKTVTRWGPLETKPSTRRRRHNVSIPVESEHLGARSSISSRCTSTRSTLFLRTLSDNPLQYDLLNSTYEMGGSQSSSPTFCQSVILTSSELNENECAATLSALLCHLAATSGNAATGAETWTDWVESLTIAISESAERNVRATLAQVVCNCKQDLQDYSDKFRTPLLSVMQQRPEERSGLNGLDVAVMDTILFWAEQKLPTNVDQQQSELLSFCLQFLLEDLISPRHASNYVPNIILGKIENLVKHFGEYISLAWGDVWKKTMIDTNFNEFALKAWQLLTQLCIPNLPVLIADSFDLKHSKSIVNKIAELYGTALGKCQTDRRDSLEKFAKYLTAVRSRNKEEYISVLFYAQNGCRNACDEDNFKIIMGLTSQMPAEPKKKCLKITANYLSGVNVATSSVEDLFQMLNVSELLVGGDYVQYGLIMAKNGIRLMEDGVRRRIVSQVLEFVGSSHEHIRKLAYEVLVSALEDILNREEAREPSPKRARYEVPSSKLLRLFHEGGHYERRLLAVLGRGLADSSEDICGLVYASIVDKLCSDRVSTRLAECMATVLLLSSEPQYCGSGIADACSTARLLSVTVRLALERVRSSDYFKRMTIRNAALKSNIESAPRTHASRLLTLSSRYQGSFSASGRSFHKIRTKKETADTDVEVPCDDILKAFIQFAANDLEAAGLLFQCVLRALVRGDAQLKTTLAQLMSSLPRSDVTPTIVEACRLYAAELAQNEDLTVEVGRLALTARGSNSEPLVRLLHEDLLLSRPGCESWVYVEEDTDMAEDKEFSINGLLQAAEQLSDWDSLTAQEKRRAVSSSAPLWTSSDNFERQLHTYFQGRAGGDSEGCLWLRQLHSVWTEEGGKQHDRWLRSAHAWPRDTFTAGVTAEAIEWFEFKSDARTWIEVCSRPVDFETGNLAQTAALLMFRSLLCVVRADSEENLSDDVAKVLRVRELAWARAACDRGAATFTMQCVNRNVGQGTMLESEVLSWRLMQLQSKLALSTNSDDIMKIFEQTESSIKAYREHSTPDQIVEMSEFLVRLSMKLGAKQINVLDRISNIVPASLGTGDYASPREKLGTWTRVHVATASYFDSVLDTCPADSKQRVLSSLADGTRSAVLTWMGEHMHSCDSKLNTVVAMTLNRLITEEDHVVESTLAQNGFTFVFLVPVQWHLVQSQRNLITQLFDCRATTAGLDGVVLDVLRRMREGGWKDVHMPKVLLDVLEEEVREREVWKGQLASLRDPTHALKALYEQLHQAVTNNDAANLAYLQEIAKESGTGLAYLILEPYRAKLRTLEGIDLSSKTAVASAKKMLSDAMRQLDQHRTSMPLADVCPALASYPDCVRERDRRCLDKLLGVENSSVVKFDRQLKVIIESQRRPVLLKALLSDGRSKTFLIKTGEDVRNDEACQHAQGYINSALGTDEIYTYKVTPLGPSAGLIEFLDNFVTVRSLLKKKVDIDLIRRATNRPHDRSIVQLSRPENEAKRRNLHKEMLSKTPINLLRSAIEEECQNVEEYIRAKAVFQNSLATMTISHWLLGVGDRHLDNLMVEPRRGTLCGVDWGFLWESRAQLAPPEPLPARLTRLLAVCTRLSAVESRMQKVLSAVRSEWRPLYAAARLAFHWQPEFNSDSYQKKLSRLKLKLSGAATSFQSILEALQDSEQPEVESLSRLIEQVGRHWSGHSGSGYSVEQQVSALLQHCTSEELLAVCRAGWEPWL